MSPYRRATPEGALVARYDVPRDEWLKLRQAGIGGSDALAVLGLDPWKTRMEVWLDKLGSAPEREQSDRMRWGQIEEAAIADWFTERTGIGRTCNSIQTPGINRATTALGLSRRENRARPCGCTGRCLTRCSIIKTP